MLVLRKPERKPEKTLVHICCAPDATYGIPAIGEVFGEVVGFFYNPNIHPEAEYLKRLEETRKLSRIYGFPLVEGAYDVARWMDAVKGLEEEPERGKRCRVCIELRMEKAMETAKKLGADAVTTVLTVSPKKLPTMVNEAGRRLAEEKGIIFIELDLKKKDGFKKSVELTKKLGIYRQNYCGCVYSFRE
ncbi:MAG: hypothetical protein D6713_10235 [Deltaproteobacteria bacterium]|nr:MAG: hypothetical protein D6713_10235 [Deltaproteobacteria bacterium]